MSTEDEKNQVDLVAEKFNDVVNNYIDFIADISKGIHVYRYMKDEKDVIVQKFNAIKTELHEFLRLHRQHFKLTKITIELRNGSVLFELDVSNVDEDDDFLSEGVALNIAKAYIDRSLLVSESVCLNYRQTYELLKHKIGKPTIENEDVQQFVENNYFFDNRNSNVKKSNYTELAAYIQQRNTDYGNSEISADNIDEMSFRFQRVGVNEEVETCPICLDDYETGQEVCCFPCGHLCCRVCTERLFSTPRLGNPEIFGYCVWCPICRRNCA